MPTTKRTYFHVSHPVVFLKFIHDTNSSQTQQFYYVITFKATCFNYIDSSSGLLENRSNVSTVIVHCGIPKAYNKRYNQYKSTRVRDYIYIYIVEYWNVKKLKVIQKSVGLYIFKLLLYRMSINTIPDYKHYKKTTWNTNIFFYLYLS
jgi:hypothetical protein